MGNMTNTMGCTASEEGRGRGTLELSIEPDGPSCSGGVPSMISHDWNHCMYSNITYTLFEIVFGLHSPSHMTRCYLDRVSVSRLKH